MRTWILLLSVVSCLGAATATACGGDDASDAAATAPAVTSAPRVAKTPNADGAVQIVAHNLAFDTDEVLAAAGMVTIELDNRDGGTPHNLHLFRGDNARGESVGETSIQNGPAQETLEVAVTAGRYFFQCDVHPNMNGVLTVS